MRYGTHGSFKYKLLQRLVQILLLAAEPTCRKMDSKEVLLTVAVAISKTLVMPKDFLTLLIHNGAGGSQAG